MKKSTQRYIDSEKNSNWLDSFLSNDIIEEKKPLPAIEEVVKDPVPKMDPIKDGDPIIDIDPDIEKEISLIQEQRLGKKLVEVLPKDSEVIVETPNLGVSLVDFFASISEEKKKLKAKVKKDKVKIGELEKLFSSLQKEKKKEKKKLLLEPEEEVIETVYVEPIEKEEETLETVEEKNPSEFIKAVEKQLSKTRYQNELDKDKLKTLDKIDSLDKMKEEFVKFKDTVSHQLSTLGGGGSVNILDNDDVDLSSKANGKVLAYNSTSGKMEFVSQSGGANLAAVDEHIIPDGDGTRDLGTSLKRWRDIYLSSDSIDLAGATISSDGTGAIAIAATGATLPEGSKTTAGNQLAVRGTGTASSNSAVIKVPFFSAAGGLSTKNAEFEFNATLDNNKPFLDQQTFTLANGSGLSSDDTITIFQL